MPRKPMAAARPAARTGVGREAAPVGMGSSPVAERVGELTLVTEVEFLLERPPVPDTRAVVSVVSVVSVVVSVDSVVAVVDSDSVLAVVEAVVSAG